MYQKQIYVTVIYFLSRGAVSVGLEKVWGQAELKADIYWVFTQGCNFIINTVTEQQSEY
jgi:hypothetical protein